MKVWGKIKSEDRILRDVTLQEDDFTAALAAVCDRFDLTKPIVCAKHLGEISNFNRTIFYPDDFIEPVNFDTLEIEIINMRKKT
jgi:hypothetical protein